MTRPSPQPLLAEREVALAGADARDAFDAGHRSATVSLRSGLASLFHDRWRILGVFALGLALTVLAAVLAPKRYAAEAELLLRLGREYIYKPELGEPAAGSPVAYDLEQTLQSEVRILASRDSLDAVLDKMGDAVVFPELQESAWRRWLRLSVLPAVSLTPQPGAPAPAPAARRAAALQQFSKALEAELLKGSNLMQVSFVHRDPQVAASVLTEVIEAYLKRRSVIFASASRGSAQANFNARQVQLKAAEKSLAAWKRENGIQVITAEQNLLLAQRNGIEERRTEARFDAARATGRAASLRDSLAGVAGDVQLSSETRPSDAVEKARSLLLDLTLKERDLSAQFSDEAPAVQDVRADIDRTKAYLQELQAQPVRTVRTGRSPARDAVESDLLRAMAEQQQASSGGATLLSAEQAANKRLAELAGSEPELNALERERRLAEENFNVAAKLLRDEAVAAQLDRERRSNVSVVQPPRVPVVARSMSGVILLVGIFASLCAALFTAFLSALWRDTFLTPEQVEQQLGLPVLASVREGAL